MLCRVVRVKNSERQSCKGCKQGGTVGKRSPLRDTGVSAFLLLCSNEKLKMESWELWLRAKRVIKFRPADGYLHFPFSIINYSTRYDFTRKV